METFGKERDFNPLVKRIFAKKNDLMGRKNALQKALNCYIDVIIADNDDPRRYHVNTEEYPESAWMVLQASEVYEYVMDNFFTRAETEMCERIPRELREYYDYVARAKYWFERAMNENTLEEFYKKASIRGVYHKVHDENGEWIILED